MGYPRLSEYLITRSQSRKSRTADLALSSPFKVLLGNQVESSSRKSQRKPANVPSFAEKENAPPSLNGQSSQISELKRPLEQKTLRKRKQSAFKAVESERDILKVPTRSDHEMCSNASQGLQCGANVSRAEACPGLGSQTAVRSAVAPTSAELQSKVPIAKFDARGAMAGDVNDAKIVMQDVSHKDPNKSADKDQNGVLLPSTSAFAMVLKDYERLFSKYKKLKARRLDEVEDLYKEQNSRIADFVRATEALIDFYNGESESSRQQFENAQIPEITKRCKSLEKANVECRNALLVEQSNNLELRHENKQLKVLVLVLEHIACKKKRSEASPVLVRGSQSGFSADLDTKERDGSTLSNHSKLVQKLLESVLGLELSCSGDGDGAHLHFQHGPTGFSFKLREVNDAEMGDVTGGGALMYQNVSVGACKRAVEWMKEEEMIFGASQAQLLLKRLTGFLNTGFYE